MLFSRHFTVEKRLYIAIAVLLSSFLLVLLGLDKAVSSQLIGLGLIGAIIAGAFYTFGITTPFAMVVLLELMRAEGGYQVAFFACMAAAAVDCYFFHALHEALQANAKKLLHYFNRKLRHISYFFPAAGFFMLALPIPDEIGLALLEMTNIKLAKVAAVVFFAKFITLIMIWKALGG
jgi:hypothetical protein